jgi:hypothetical protein
MVLDMEWVELIIFREGDWVITNLIMFLEEVTLVVFLVVTMVKKIYVCQNVVRIIIKTEIKQIEKQKFTNQILKLILVKFNQIITLSLEVSREITFYLKMTISTQKSFLARKKKEVVKIPQNLLENWELFLHKLKTMHKEPKRTVISVLLLLSTIILTEISTTFLKVVALYTRVALVKKLCKLLIRFNILQIYNILNKGEIL